MSLYNTVSSKVDLDVEVDLVIEGRGLFVQSAKRLPDAWKQVEDCKNYFSSELQPDKCAVYRVTLQERGFNTYSEIFACIQLASDKFVLGNDHSSVEFGFVQSTRGNGGMLVVKSVIAYSRSGHKPGSYKWAEVVKTRGVIRRDTFLYRLYV